MKPNVLPEFRDIIERAEATYHRVYVGHLKEALERTAWGRYVAINIDTDEYLVAPTRREALEQFHERFPGAMAHLVRVGSLPLIA